MAEDSRERLIPSEILFRNGVFPSEWKVSVADDTRVPVVKDVSGASLKPYRGFETLICDEGAFRGPRQANGPPLRSLPALQIPNDHLITWLSSGQSYDVASVERKLVEGNERFDNGDHAAAFDAYGVAYQVYRLVPHPFRPLAHDLVLRRVLCLSYLGRLDEALNECEVALTIVPKAPTTLLLHGLLSYRSGLVLQANESFESCMRQDPDLMDCAQLIIAAMLQATGRAEDAIEVASRVVRRADSVFARIVRGDCYKFHPKGCFGGEAAEDYSTALMADPSISSLLGRGFAPASARGHLERLLLHFHPWLWRNFPRVLQHYQLYGFNYNNLRNIRTPNNFSYTVWVGLVLLCVARLKRLVRNRRQRQREAEEKAAYEAKQNTLEGRLQNLCEAARLSEDYFRKNNHGSKEAALVNGQVHKARAVRPRSAHDYRRIWNEQPQGFPRRQESGNAKSPSRGHCTKSSASKEKKRTTTDSQSNGGRENYFDDIVGEFDPGREVCDLLKSTDTSKVRYVADFCAPNTSIAVGMLAYPRQVRSLPETDIVPEFKPLWDRHRDVSHEDLSSNSKFPLEVTPKANLPLPPKKLPLGVRDFIKRDAHLRGLVKREGFV